MHDPLTTHLGLFEFELYKPKMSCMRFIKVFGL